MRKNRCIMYQTNKIAILLATYNGEKYLSQQIESVISQSEKEWTLYIHDDGSKDRTADIIKEYAEKYPEQIVVVEGEATGGAKNNFFYLFHQVEAPYYMCCDQDDVWLPEKIVLTKKAMNSIEMDENISCLAFTELTVVDETLQVIAEKMSEYQGLDCVNMEFNRALIQNVVTGCTMMVNRALRDEMIKITDYHQVLMHDWWAALVATKYGKTAFVKEPTILYRQHGKNSVGAQNAKTFAYMLKRMMQGQEIKASLENTRLQAGFFAKVYENESPGVAREYATIGEKRKMQRLSFYKKNNIKKSTKAKNLGLFIWG